MSNEWHFVGVDYSTKKVSWAVLSGPLVDYPLTLRVNELALPGSGDIVENVALLAGYLSDELAVELERSDTVVIERPIAGISLNQLTAAGMAMVCGALTWELKQVCLHVSLVNNTTWKKEVIGSGAAKKKDVLAAMKERWGSVITSEDIADATAMAMYAQLHWVEI